MVNEIPLNENQARRLRIYFGHLVAESRDLAESLSGFPEPRPPWVPVVMDDIEQLIHAVRGVAGELRLDIDSRKDDPARRVIAWAGVWWARALDCRPVALQGYGPVDPALDRSLAPAIDEIAAILHGIRARVEEFDGEAG